MVCIPMPTFLPFDFLDVFSLLRTQHRRRCITNEQIWKWANTWKFRKILSDSRAKFADIRRSRKVGREPGSPRFSKWIYFLVFFFFTTSQCGRSYFDAPQSAPVGVSLLWKWLQCRDSFKEAHQNAHWWARLQMWCVSKGVSYIDHVETPSKYAQ